MTDDKGVTCTANRQGPLQAIAAVVNDDLKLCQPMLLRWPGRFHRCITQILRAMQQADFYRPLLLSAS